MRLHQIKSSKGLHMKPMIQIATIPVKPLFIFLVVTLSLLLVLSLLLPSSPFSQRSGDSIFLAENVDIWRVKRLVERIPCKWWLQGHLTALPAKSNGYIRIDCYGGLNQMRRDLCDGVGIACLLNATLVLPIGMNRDVYDVEYFINQMNGFVSVTKELPAEIASKEPFHVDCSKRKGHFDYSKVFFPYYWSTNSSQLHQQ